MGRQTSKWSYKHDKLTQCCRAFTLALARLSCFISPVERRKHDRRRRGRFVRCFYGSFWSRMRKICQQIKTSLAVPPDFTVQRSCGRPSVVAQPWNSMSSTCAQPAWVVDRDRWHCTGHPLRPRPAGRRTHNVPRAAVSWS